MIYTYLNMIEECTASAPRGWHEFVKRYLPLAKHFASQYFPASNSDARVAALFAAASEDDGRFFRSYEGRTEREFMVHFRSFVLALLRKQAAPGPAAELVSLDTMDIALKDFSALQRQVVWLFALAYTPEQMGPVFGLEPGTAGEMIEAAQQKLRSSMDVWSQDSLRASGWSLCDAASARDSKDCYPYLIFHRMMDGQVTWKEQEAVLVHLTRCFRCVDRFCSLQEVVYLSRMLPAAPPEEIERVVAALGFSAAPAKPKSLIGRLFR